MNHEVKSVHQGPRIYNLFPRIVGAMKAWIPHMERAKNMGFNWIYINPFHYPGFSGSLYSIKDYYGFNPHFMNPDDHRNGIDQLKEVVMAANDLGLQLMMDLVINHTAIDSILLEKHKDWYVLKPDGSVKNPEVREGDKIVTVWGDLAEVDNASSPDLDNLKNYWENLITYYLDVGFHGFRCDAAYKVPIKMWEFLIQKAKEHVEETIFFAETLGCEMEDVINLAKSGFDYTFNSSKWWDFVEPWCLNQYKENAPWAPSISFPESHDCKRLMDDFDGNINAVKMRYAFAALFSTGVMMPIGFEYGFRKPLNVVTTVPTDWEDTEIDLSPFIKKMNEIKAAHQVFNEDNPITTLHIDNQNIFAFMKTSNDSSEKSLIFLNRSLESKQRFSYHDLKKLFNMGGQIMDISVDHRMEFIPNDFEYILEPSQIRVLYCHQKAT